MPQQDDHRASEPVRVHDFASECKAIAHVEDANGVLCCYLGSGHDGLHWDAHDGVWWTTEQPGGAS